ncbi:MAG: hypothetical protein AAF927_06975 [Bacteroidota bacterium]
MNKKEARGQKWFGLIFFVLIGPKLWRLALNILNIFDDPYAQQIQSYYIVSVSLLALMIFVTTGAFILMYNGYKWAKIVYLILLTIPIGFLIYGIFFFLKEYEYTEDSKSMYVTLAREIAVLLVPGLLLLFMPSTRIFLNYRYYLRVGDTNKMEQQLNRIGNNEQT